MRRQFKPGHTRPRDFASFWETTLAELDALDPALDRTARQPVSHPDLVLEDVSFQSLGGVRISAQWLHWRDASSRPLIIHSHGYGSACQPRYDWANAGLNILGVDIRGFGRSHDALSEPSHWGWILTGIRAPETSALRGAVCDYIRASQVAAELTGGRHTRTVYHGVSFAGGLALMAAAMFRNPDLLVTGVPTFGWMEGRFLFVKSGSGAQINRYLSFHPERIDDVMLVLRYFDPVNFADAITCPTLMGIGLEDEVVPAKTVYAIANHLAGPREIMEFPVSHTDHPDEQLWEHFERRWVQLAVEGVDELTETKSVS